MSTRGKTWAWASVLVVAIVCVVLMNVFSIPAHDELSYAFAGQSTSDIGFCPRINSFMDIVRQQYCDYMRANGRVFVHGLVAFFAGFRLYYLFDIVNSCFWFAFVFLILKEAYIEITIKRFTCASLLIFMTWWYSENVSMNAAFGVNYLWMACASLAIMRLWRKLNSWWWLPVGFVYGWGQEAFSLPMVATLGGCIVVQSIREKRYAASAKQTMFLLAMTIGTVGLTMSPGIRARADRSLDFSLFHFLIAAIKWVAGLSLSIWPMVIVMMVICVLWKMRKRLCGGLYDDLEWWLFFIASFGLSFLTCQSGIYRICSSWLMAGIVIVLRNRGATFIESKAVCGFAYISFAWLLVGTALQTSYGLANFKMLRIYSADAQGITYRETIPPMFWNTVCSVGTWDDAYHLNMFRQEYRKERSPIVLSKKLYEMLYIKPALFFESSIKDGNVYIWSEADGVAVKKGCVDFSEEEKARLKARLEPKGWKRFLPGRLKQMFPSDVWHVYIPSKTNQISIMAKDGNMYTIYKYVN